MRSGTQGQNEMADKKIPAAPILAELDQETFAAGWADGWRGDFENERVYRDERSPEAVTYRMGRIIATEMRSLNLANETEN